MDSLPLDYCRCEGAGCDRKESCLRHLALNDMGPRTPVSQYMCGWGEQFIDHYIPTETKKEPK